ncbi:MAG: GtrA family protein [Prevotella copri]|nr:GtrA family protein [Segatella copri]
MKKIFDIFKIKKEERWLALGIFLALAILNGVVIARYAGTFTLVTDDYYKNFIRHFCVSGFDPLTYWVLSDWNAAYNVYRHPLLAFYMYIPYLINMGLMKLTGYNCALFIAVIIQMFCGFYATLFLQRIFREVLELDKAASSILTLLFFSFGYVMVTCIVPDHFVISMLLLILALYVSGRRIKHNHPLKIWQTVVYFVLTAGTSLNNGLKIFFSALFVNRKRFFRPKYLLLAVILPAALLWGFCRWEYRTFVWPVEMARKEMKAKKAAEKEARQERMAQLKQIKDSLTKDSIQRGLKIITPEEIAQKAKNDSIQKAKQLARNEARKKRGPKQGAPIMKGEFMNWTDATSSRTLSIVENLMGESIQLHQDYVLQDELRHRPMFVNYRYAFNYIVEALIIILFLAGIWAGRKSRYLWLVMSYFGLDMLLHIGLGFGLNEVYIMTGHWIYALPIAIGFLLKETRHQRYSLCLKSLLLTIGLFLLIYNGILIIGYFC